MFGGAIGDVIRGAQTTMAQGMGSALDVARSSGLGPLIPGS